MRWRRLGRETGRATAAASGGSWSRLASTELRIPRVRVSVRALMIAVAMSGILIWLGMSREGSLRMRQYHEDRAGRERVFVEQGLADWKVYQNPDSEGAFRKVLERVRSDAKLVREMERDRLSFLEKLASMARDIERHRRLVEYHERLKEKYGHAAGHPWLPVHFEAREPDGMGRGSQSQGILRSPVVD